MPAPAGVPASIAVVLVDELGIYPTAGAVVSDGLSPTAGHVDVVSASVQMSTRRALGAPWGDSVSCAVIGTWHGLIAESGGLVALRRVAGPREEASKSLCLKS